MAHRSLRCNRRARSRHYHRTRRGMSYLSSLSRVRVYKASDVCCMAVLGQCSSAENIVLIPRIAVGPLVQFLFVITDKKRQQVTNDLSAPASHQLQFGTISTTDWRVMNRKLFYWATVSHSRPERVNLDESSTWVKLNFHRTLPR